MDAVFRLADRISVLVQGRLIATDAPASIKRNAEVRKAYLGDELEDTHVDAHSTHGASA
jgi:branched-chain amino acid transport system ATP-binding protein